jgi:hypothetical protein
MKVANIKSDQKVEVELGCRKLTDNVVAESFIGRLKQERVHWRNY